MHGPTYALWALTTHSSRSRFGAWLNSSDGRCGEHSEFQGNELYRPCRCWWVLADVDWRGRSTGVPLVRLHARRCDGYPAIRLVSRPDWRVVPWLCLARYLGRWPGRSWGLALARLSCPRFCSRAARRSAILRRVLPGLSSWACRWYRHGLARPARDLTTHSSRARFAGRLDSSVRPAWKDRCESLGASRARASFRAAQASARTPCQ